MEFSNLYHKYKNRERYQEILRILTRHGFKFLLLRRGIGSISYWRQRILPRYPKPAVPGMLPVPLTLPERVRMLFEDLGTSFIKLGQVLSTRPDLIPRDYAEELGKLQDKVVELSSDDIRRQFLKAWGRLPEEMFREFDYRAAASASIAQVHRARLEDGQAVAVKIQRPGLTQMVEKDIAIVKDFEKLLQRSVVGKVCDIGEIIGLFSRQIRREVDFTVEALNMERFYTVFADSRITVPKVYWGYTTTHILTMDWIEGVPAKEAVNVVKGEEAEQLAKLMLEVVLLPFFREGIFHGDPHPGNVFWQQGGRLALVDFGITGRLDEEFRFTVAELMLAISKKDTCSVVELTKRLGVSTGDIDEEHLYHDISEMLDRAVGMKEGGISFSNLVNGMINIALQHGIKMPGSFFLLGKAMLVAEGLARKFDAGVDVVQVAHPFAVDYLKRRLQPSLDREQLYRGSVKLARGLMSFPKDVARVISHLAEGELSIVFVHRGLETLYDKLDVVSTRLAISLIIVAMMVSSALVIHASPGPMWALGYPLLGALGFGMAAVLGAWMIVGLIRDGKIR